jgi:hypothetical protein
VLIQGSRGERVVKVDKSAAASALTRAADKLGRGPEAGRPYAEEVELPDNPHDVYRLLVGPVEEGKVDEIVGVIAFGLFWDELEEWRLHRTRQGGAEPTGDDIDRHIQGDLPDRYFSELRAKALQLFGEGAVDFLSSQIEQERRDAVESSILSAVQARLAEANASISSRLAQVEATVARGSSWWRQFGMALLLSVIVPVVLGLTLVGIGAFDRLFPSPSEIGGAVTPQEPTPARPGPGG